eukprot:3638686-Pyramimonas_sp.AAC.1
MTETLDPPRALPFAAPVEAAAAVEACGGDRVKKIHSLGQDINSCEKAEDAEQVVCACRLQKTAQEDH